MINYLQLGRNLRKFVPKTEATSATYIYNAKGIYDFKQMKPEIAEELTNSFRGVDNPVLEISVKKAKHPAGIIKVKDGEKELSTDTFVLEEGTNAEEFLPQTNGCLKTMFFDDAGISRICEKCGLLGKFLNEMLAGVNKPRMEFWIKARNKYTIGNVVLRDGKKEILRGYFSKANNMGKPIEKFHFKSEDKLITGHGTLTDMRKDENEVLPEKLRKRLWMLDDRSKSMLMSRYGIECSPVSAKAIAKQWNLTSARVRGIIQLCRQEMETANTYSKELGSDLDNLGNVLSDKERYNVYRHGSSYDINMAVYKIKKQKLEAQKMKK